MKKIIALTVVFAMVVSLVTVANSTEDSINMEQIQWLIDGEFSFEFTAENGQTGIVTGQNGNTRVYRDMGDGIFQEQTNHAVMADFGRNFRLIDIENYENYEYGFEKLEEGFHSIIFPIGDNEMTFIFYEGEMYSAAFRTSLIKIDNLVNEPSGIEPETLSTKTQLWWIIDAARGIGEFSFEFELAPTAAQIEQGTHGQRGILEAKNGDVRVYHLNANGTYTETTNSAVMANFGRNLRLLTQAGHNHNNEATANNAESRPIPPSVFPEWLGLTQETWANGNFELFPRTTHNTLANALNPFDLNLVAADRGTPIDRTGDMLFIYETSPGTTPVMTAALFNNTWIRIDNLKPEISGIEPATLSTKTQLWWIIDAARGNGEFSFEFELEDGEQGVVFGKDGVVEVNGLTLVKDIFANNFKYLTQAGHNHNNEAVAGDQSSRPFDPATFPEWLGLNQETWANGNFELFPLVAHATLTNALNPFDLNLVAADRGTPIDRTGDMLFVYETSPGTTPVMAAAYFDGRWIKIKNLQNCIESVNVTCDCGECEECKPEVPVTSAPVTTNEPSVTTAPDVTTAPTTATEPPATSAPVEPDRIPGDVDNDGKVTILDALEILMYLAGMPSELDKPANYAAAGAITGGDKVTISDALEILMHLAGMASALGEPAEIPVTSPAATTSAAPPPCCEPCIDDECTDCHCIDPSNPCINCPTRK
jgi:hypothetical protein